MRKLDKLIMKLNRENRAKFDMENPGLEEMPLKLDAMNKMFGDDFEYFIEGTPEFFINVSLWGKDGEPKVLTFQPNDMTGFDMDYLVSSRLNTGAYYTMTEYTWFRPWYKFLITIRRQKTDILGNSGLADKVLASHTSSHNSEKDVTRCDNINFAEINWLNKLKFGMMHPDWEESPIDIKTLMEFLKVGWDELFENPPSCFRNVSLWTEKGRLTAFSLQPESLTTDDKEWIKFICKYNGLKYIPSKDSWLQPWGKLLITIAR